MAPGAEVRHLFDAGMFIEGILEDDPRYKEARPLVEAARRGDITACTTTGILAEVYAGLTHQGATPRHTPEEAARIVFLLVKAPSSITVLQDQGLDTAALMLSLAERKSLRARDVHDARHAATALGAGVRSVYTYDPEDWRRFETEGLVIAGPPSLMGKLARS